MDIEQAYQDHLDDLSGVKEPLLTEPVEPGCCMLCGEFIAPGTGATADSHFDCI